MVAQKRKAISMIVAQKRKAVDVEPQEKHVKENKVEDKADSEKSKIRQEEQEVMAARRKELKATSVDQLKDLALNKGLEICKKEDMIEAVVRQEAKARAEARAHAASTRAAVMNKKAELEALSAPELKEICAAKGIAASAAKSDRVEEVLKEWLENGGVEKVLAKAAHDARETSLMEMDKATLRKMSTQAGIDPFVKEVIVDRIIRSEVASGRFARPVFQPLDAVLGDEAPKSKTVDLVDAVLASEESRRKEMELKREQEAAKAHKKEELKAMNIEQLKKLLTTKGQQAVGKKDEMVETLFNVYMQEKAAIATKSKLKVLDNQKLIKLVQKRGLKVGKRDEMVEALLSHEAQIPEIARAYAVKFQEACGKKKSELEGKTAVELKELCSSKGLKPGLCAEDRVERLIEQAKIDGDIDIMVALVARAARSQELSSMNMESLQKICEETGVDPLVKEIMVERLLFHESEFGPITKKARKTK